MNEKTRLVPRSQEGHAASDIAADKETKPPPTLRSTGAPALGEVAAWGNNFRTFRIFYIGMIIFTVLVARIDPDGAFLVALRFGVVFVLAFWGFRLSGWERAEAGHRVQTAGYLEALIGIGAALILLQEGKKSGLEQIALPIATSIGTSIVGWLLGGELAGRYSGPSGSSPSTLLGEDHDFSSELLQAQSRYLRIVDDITASLAKAGQAHLDLVNAANESSREGARLASNLSERIRNVQSGLEEGLAALEKGTNRGMVASAEELRKSLQQASTELKEAMGAVSASAKQFSEFTREAKVLIQSLDEMMRYIASTRGKS